MKKPNAKWTLIVGIIIIGLAAVGLTNPIGSTQNTPNSNSKNPQGSTPTANVESSAPTEYKLENREYGLEYLDIKLPLNWQLETNDRFRYVFDDDKGEFVGTINSYNYDPGFDFQRIKPNHAALLNEEAINTPLGQGRLYTMEADNGTAASGITGTHYAYYALIIIKDKAIYELEFDMTDKNPETKNEFVSILKGLSFKNQNATDNHPSTTTTDYYHPSVLVTNESELEIAKSLLQQYLQHYKNDPVPVSERLKDYKISEVAIRGKTASGFVFTAKFSVQVSNPSQNVNFSSGNGVVQSNGWIDDKFMFVTVTRKNDTFTITGWATSP